MPSMSARQIIGENGEDGTLLEWAARFSTEGACERFLFETAHPEGRVCPRCGNRRCTPMRTRRRAVQCTRCGRQESLTAGTAMENTKLPLTKWFLAAWLVSHSKRGVSGLELARQAGVCEKTGGSVLLRLRGAMSGSECLRPAPR